LEVTRHRLRRKRIISEHTGLENPTRALLG
jgi:hypothetical protein